MDKIIVGFHEFMSAHGTQYNEFYFGIARDPIDRLVNGHRVTEGIPNIFSKIPLHSDVVREIERYFLNLGCRGGTGGGDIHTRHVYAYKIGPTTRE